MQEIDLDVAKEAILLIASGFEEVFQIDKRKDYLIQ
jgi:hypothetical protein